MRHGALLLIGVLGQSAASVGHSQGMPAISAEAAGFSPDRLEAAHEMLASMVERGGLPGAVALIVRHGRVVSARAFGVSDLDTRRPMKVDDIFRLASATKIPISVAALSLYEEGVFLLSDPVSKFIPELASLRVFDESGMAVPAHKPLTIRDLLRHTSGYGYGHSPQQRRAYLAAGIRSEDPDLLYSHESTLAEWVGRLATVPLVDEPGTRFEYGFAHDILGLLIERATGRQLDEFLRERITTPLGLDDTGFTIRADAVDRLTTVYHMNEEGLPQRLDGGATSSFRHRPRAFSGGGGWDNVGRAGLVSTAPDLARLLQVLLNGGEIEGKRVLGRRTVELMLRNHLAGLEDPTSMWPGVGYGFGVAVLFDPDAFGEYGSTGKFWWAGSTNVYCWVDPAEELIGIVMAQVLPFGYRDLMDRFEQLVYQALVDDVAN